MNAPTTLEVAIFHSNLLDLLIRNVRRYQLKHSFGDLTVTMCYIPATLRQIFWMIGGYMWCGSLATVSSGCILFLKPSTIGIILFIGFAPLL